MSAPHPSPDEVFMAEALACAKRGWGHTHPNPMVGCVIVEAGEVVARGWHERAGEAHAEVHALKRLGRSPAPDAELYVTLEPCSTRGRTGACTEAIQQAGIRSVIIGALDPNPAHAGRGPALLEAAGITVKTGVLAEACGDLNLIFNHWITRQTPFFAWKVATTLDGKTATRTGHSRWITGEAARADVMHWRRYFPAILVGAQTAVLDNPALTSRVGESVWCPRRIVLDRKGQTAAPETLESLNVFNDDYEAQTIVAAASTVPQDALSAWRSKGVEVWQLEGSEGNDAAFFADLKKRCMAAGLYGVFVESGGVLGSALWQAGALDYLFHYQAPKIIGDEAAPAAWRGFKPAEMGQALQLEHVRRAQFEGDALLRGFIAGSA